MSDGGYGDGYDAGFSEGEKIWKAKALDLEVKRDIAVSTLEKVKADRSVAMKALAAQCNETRRLRAELVLARKVSVTLTGKEIRELAEFAGLQVVDHNYVDEYETEITVETLSGFLLNDSLVEEHYRLIAYFTECPEEGAIGLGDVLPTVQEPQINLEGYREAGSSLAGENGWDSRLVGD
jgi:hypothetical protein